MMPLTIELYILLAKNVALQKLLEKYNEIWNKVNNTIKKGVDSESLYNEKYLRTKKNFMKEKSAQIFMEIKYQKKIFSVFVYC